MSVCHCDITSCVITAAIFLVESSDICSVPPLTLHCILTYLALVFPPLSVQCPFIDEYILALHNKIRTKPVEFPET